MNDDLGVALGAELMTQGLQLGHQLLVVVDFAVEDDSDAAVFVKKGLLTGGDINHRQAAVAESDTRLQMNTGLIRSTMGLNVVDAINQGRCKGLLAARVKKAGNSAHGSKSDVRGWIWEDLFLRPSTLQ